MTGLVITVGLVGGYLFRAYLENVSRVLTSPP
jgi:hypothetical protein